MLNFYEWAGKKRFAFFWLEGQSGVRTRDLQLSKQVALPLHQGLRPIGLTMIIIGKMCFIFYTTDIWILSNMYNYNMTQTYVSNIALKR